MPVHSLPGRLRVIDLFRHWEGGEKGAIGVEHFRAGLLVTFGVTVAKRDVISLFESMGSTTDTLPFAQLKRQLRVATQRGSSLYLREAAKRGTELEASTPRGAMCSGVSLEECGSSGSQECVGLRPALTCDALKHSPDHPPQPDPGFPTLARQQAP